MTPDDLSVEPASETGKNRRIENLNRIQRSRRLGRARRLAPKLQREIGLRFDLSADCIASQDVGVQIPRLGARGRSRPPKGISASPITHGDMTGRMDGDRRVAGMSIIPQMRTCVP